MNPFLKCKRVASRITSALLFEKMLDSVNIATRPVDNPSLLSFGTDVLNEFNFSIYTIKLINKGLRRDTGKLLEEAISLLATLRKEYNLQ